MFLLLHFVSFFHFRLKRGPGEGVRLFALLFTAYSSTLNCHFDSCIQLKQNLLRDCAFYCSLSYWYFSLPFCTQCCPCFLFRLLLVLCFCALLSHLFASLRFTFDFTLCICFLLVSHFILDHFEQLNFSFYAIFSYFFYLF